MSPLHLRIYNAHISFLPVSLLTGGNNSRSFLFLIHVKDFSKFSALGKKNTRANREAEQESCAASKTNKNNSNNDPYDFSVLHEGIKERMTWLQSELSKLRTGGKFNLDLLENLRVVVRRDSKKTESLGDLAQIIPRGGRNVTIQVGEKTHVQSIISAIQNAALNIQPVQDANDPTQLTVPIPPPSKESRDLALKTASKVGEMAITRIRLTRGIVQKKLRNIELRKLARPDDLKKAHKEMEKIVENGITDVKKTVNTVRKAMEQI